jgi:hypothetical protein
MKKRAIVAISVIAAATTLHAAVVHADPASTEWITSPSGDVACLLDDGSSPDMQYGQIQCVAINPNWAPPPRLPHCPDPHQPVFFLASAQPQRGEGTPGALLQCYQNTNLDPPADLKTLAFGQTLSAGPITCDSEPTGIRCTASNGHFFRVSRESYELR